MSSVCLCVIGWFAFFLLSTCVVSLCFEHALRCNCDHATITAVPCAVSVCSMPFPLNVAHLPTRVSTPHSRFPHCLFLCLSLQLDMAIENNKSAMHFLERTLARLESQATIMAEQQEKDKADKDQGEGNRNDKKEGGEKEKEKKGGDKGDSGDKDPDTEREDEDGEDDEDDDDKEETRATMRFDPVVSGTTIWSAPPHPSHVAFLPYFLGRVYGSLGATHAHTTTSLLSRHQYPLLCPFFLRSFTLSYRGLFSGHHFPHCFITWHPLCCFPPLSLLSHFL